MSLFLGLDLGTSSLKAVLFDPDQRAVIGVGSEEYPILRPKPNYAEQDPDQWWQAAISATRRAIEQSGRSDISAIGFSGQMHGTVLVDAQGRPVHPAIIWADQRATVDDIGEMVDSTRVGDGDYFRFTGALPCLGFMGATLYWLSRHAQEILAAAHHVMLPKDYLRFKLTGEIGTEVSDAASTGIFNIHEKRWMHEFLDTWGIPLGLFPPVAASSAVAGFVTREAADALGIAPGVPVVYGAADQPAQAIGNGLIAPGRMSITIGSGGQVFTPMRVGLGEQVKTDWRLMVFNHAVPDTYYAEAAILSAGLSLRWLRGIVGLEGHPDAYPILSAEAAPIPPGADGLRFLPSLIDERNPWARQATSLFGGGFSGLKLHHTRGHMARAVMEGVAFAIKEQVEIIQTMTEKPSSVIAAGGAMDSAVWRGILADVLDLPLTRSVMSEQAGLGAALIAAVGVGYWKTFEQACADVVRYGEVTEPDRAHAQSYAEQYQQWSAIRK
ncbi:MAG: xylulokinase [Anaerolineae bacterium]